MIRALPLFVLLLAGNARAETDAQAWAFASASGPIGGRLLLAADAQARAGDGPRRFRQSVFRLGLGWQVDGRTRLLAGYALVRTGDTRARATEHRLWQQVGIDLIDDGRVQLDSRTRLEQRFFDGSGRPAFRLRQQLRAAMPLAAGVAVLVTTEGFAHLNRAGPARAGLDRWRNFAGVRVRIDDVVALETGYLRQTVFRPGSDGTNHIGLLGLAARW